MGEFNIKEDGGIVRLSEKLEENFSKRQEVHVFISHDARDCHFAKLFYKLIEGASQELLQTFCSSRTGDITYGDEWYKKLMTEIDSSTAIICLLTKNSVKKPWILFEAGLAKGKFPNRKIRGLVIDTNVRPHSPFSHFQQCKCEKEDVMELIKQLISEHTNSKTTNKDVVKVIEKHVNLFLKSINQAKVKMAPVIK